MNRTLVISAVFFLLSDCARAPEVTEPPAPSSAPTLSGDSQLLKVADRLPGFGGMFFDDNGDLNVYLLEDIQALSAEAMEDRTARVQVAIAAVLGESFLAQGRAPQSDQGRTAPPQQSARIKIVEGDYDIKQLVRWRADVNNVLALPGVISTDLDERRNRLAIGIETPASRPEVEAALARMGVPSEAVIIEITQPIEFLATLRDRFRSMPGGVQIEADTGVFSSKTCTMGFNAVRFGVSGFVTNSHCTTNQGGSEGTDFHQPDDPVFSEGNKVGDEIADPQYFTGEPCPPGRRCRFSDSAFVDYTVARGANIARTTGRNNGSLTLSTSQHRLIIVGELYTWADGVEMDKIGRTTGWTAGRLSGTCHDINVTNTDITLLCQERVNRMAGQTLRMSDHGDSGSPVFRWLGNDVFLSGILWGSPEDGSAFLFSPINQIEQELGPLTTFDFSPGPVPGQCPIGRRCCGVVNPDGTCDGQCWPTGNPCP